MTVPEIKSELRKYASAKKAALLRGFFKTGQGEYGEGDVFIGVKVPETRKVAVLYADLSRKDTLALLASPIHEERLLALLILIRQYENGDGKERAGIVETYLKNTRHTNNWDLIDLSAHKILGHWLKDRDRSILEKLARSESMWERRISIVATYAFIRENDLKDTFHIADILISDTEDLMHKATGWMLREAGKRDVIALEEYLQTRYQKMPRTMLRYAIERLPEPKRRAYLLGKI